MLAPCAGGPVDLHLNVLGANLHFYIFRQVGHDLYRGKGGEGRPAENRVGQPDPLLCLHALPDGEGQPHRLRDQQHQRRNGRRMDPGKLEAKAIIPGPLWAV